MLCEAPMCDLPFTSLLDSLLEGIANGEIFYFNLDVLLTKSLMLEINRVESFNLDISRTKSLTLDINRVDNFDIEIEQLKSFSQIR